MAVTVDDVLLFCSRFDRTVRALTRRDANKPPFAFKDEYDVQDITYAALKPLVDDLVVEDPTSKVAGLSGRVDLVSYRLGLAIEVKATLAVNRDPKDIVTECFERVKKYSSVRGIRVLAFFIHDPDQKIDDPDNVQRDLEAGRHAASDGGTFIVRVVGPRFSKTFGKSESGAAPIDKPRREKIADNDALNELYSWFELLRGEQKKTVIIFADVDRILGLPEGTAKRFLAQAVSEDYHVMRQGEDSIMFTFRESAPHFGTDIYENGWGGRGGL
jgi:hypothetical protein